MGKRRLELWPLRLASACDTLSPSSALLAHDSGGPAIDERCPARRLSTVEHAWVDSFGHAEGLRAHFLIACYET
jgi:hypothetical protein